MIQNCRESEGLEWWCVLHLPRVQPDADEGRGSVERVVSVGDVDAVLRSNLEEVGGQRRGGEMRERHAAGALVRGAGTQLHERLRVLRSRDGGNIGN